MGHFDGTTIFVARLAPGFESNPKSDKLYEVVTPDGERIASATSELRCRDLAGELNSTLRRWPSASGSMRCSGDDASQEGAGPTGPAARTAADRARGNALHEGPA